MDEPVRPRESSAFPTDPMPDETKPRPAGQSSSRALVSIREPSIRVAVIDDDPAILEMISDVLRLPFFETSLANTAHMFFEILDRRQPHVVLIDMKMPHKDGIDILGALRANAFVGEVVLMSGADRNVLETSRRIAAAYGLQVAGYIQKPFTANQLLAAIDRSGANSRISDMRIKSALNDGEIRPYFQPKIQLRSGKIIGAEALSRWHHPQRGLLMPQAYLDNVQTSGGQSLHDYCILDETMELCAKLNATGRQLKFSVNFTAEVLLSHEFIEVIRDTLHNHAVLPEQLIIELTEADATDNMEALTERLLKLRLLGSQVSIDDFGTGHSSLSHLQRLPMSEVKLDRFFVNGLTEDSDDYALVRSIIELARSMQLPVVAEGVETIETLAALRKMGCDIAQGHIFSPAVNETTFLTMVKNKMPVFPNFKSAT